MSLLTDLSQVGRTGRPCEFAAWIEALEPDERAAVRAAVADRSKPYRKVAAVITANGYPVSAATVENHRRGGCVTCRSLTS